MLTMNPKRIHRISILSCNVQVPKAALSPIEPAKTSQKDRRNHYRPRTDSMTLGHTDVSSVRDNEFQVNQKAGFISLRSPTAYGVAPQENPPRSSFKEDEAPDECPKDPSPPPSCLKVDKLKRQRLRVVLANGCFDLIHQEHTRLFAEPRRPGDVLAVAMNAESPRPQGE